jgi:hypothetical protein
MSLSIIATCTPSPEAAAIGSTVKFEFTLPGGFHRGDIFVMPIVGKTSTAYELYGTTVTLGISKHDQVAVSFPTRVGDVGDTTVSFQTGAVGVPVICGMGFVIRGGAYITAGGSGWGDSYVSTNASRWNTSASGASPRTASLAGATALVAAAGYQTVVVVVNSAEMVTTSHTLPSCTAPGGTDLGTITGEMGVNHDFQTRTGYTIFGDGVAATMGALSNVVTWSGGGSERAGIGAVAFQVKLMDDPVTLVEQASLVGKTVTIDLTGTDDTDVAPNSIHSYEGDQVAPDVTTGRDWLSNLIEWGDGNSETRVYSDTYNYAPGDGGPLYEHTYAVDGTYTVTVTSTDLYGNESDAELEVVVGTPFVAEVPPPPFEPASRRVDIRELPHQVSSVMFDDL